MSDRARKIIIIIGCVIVFGGVVGLLYPFVGNWINSRNQTAAVEDYQEVVKSIEDSENERLLEEAREYNRKLFARSASVTALSEDEMEEYNGILDMSLSTIMGYLDIPKLDLSLPIYHGTSEGVLQVGVGHLAGSSFPVGGENTHAVLTGHSGLPSSELFTNLDELKIGDTFSITVLDNVVTYSVFDVSVFLPEDVDLEFEEGSDYCTLITCTPIGANTHRLVVRAKRVDTDAAVPVETPQELQ